MLVESALEFLKNPEKKPQSSGEVKQYLYPLLKLGDRVSIAALKIYGGDELAESETAEAYLTAVRNAFSDRRSVVEAFDLNPKVTLFVLEYLQQKEVAEAGIEKRIEYLKRCVKDFTCSSQREYDFFHKP
jgi:hypothetical protein